MYASSGGGGGSGSGGSKISIYSGYWRHCTIIQETTAPQHENMSYCLKLAATAYSLSVCIHGREQGKSAYVQKQEQVLLFQSKRLVPQYGGHQRCAVAQ